MPRLICLLTLFIYNIFLTGCWDAREVNNMVYPVIIGIDKTASPEEQKAEKYLYTYSLPVLSQETQEPRTLHTLSTYSMQESLASLQAQVHREINLGQISVIAFGEDLAREGVQANLTFFERTVQIRGDTILVISEEKPAKELLNHQVPDIGVGIYLVDLFRFASTQNFIPATTLNDFLIDTSEKVSNTIIPTVKTSGKQLYLSGLAVFKKDRMVGKLNRTEGRLLTIVRNEAVQGVISKPNFNGTTEDISALLRGGTKITPFYKNGKFSFLVEINLTGDLGQQPYLGGVIDSPELLAKIERQLATQVKGGTEKLVEKLQKEMQTDVLGLGQAAAIKYHQEFDPQKWEQQFPEADVKINVKLKIHTVGIST